MTIYVTILKISFDYSYSIDKTSGSSVYPVDGNNYLVTFPVQSGQTVDVPESASVYSLKASIFLLVCFLLSTKQY